MRRIHLLAVLLAISCNDSSPQTATLERGTMRIEREGGAVLLDAPARAMACARDTTLAIVAVGEEWGAALSIRLLLPVDSPLTVPVLTHINRPRSAMVALRTLGDSLHGWSGVGGTVRLDTGSALAGSFDATFRRDTTTMQASGRFSSPRPADRCP